MEPYMAKSPSDRRRYLRLLAPIGLRVISKDNSIEMTSMIDLSPRGLRYQSKDIVKEGQVLDITLIIPEAQNPVHVTGKVVWSRNNNVGCEFVKIEEDNKNTFLKFFCDLIYAQTDTDNKEDNQ